MTDIPNVCCIPAIFFFECEGQRVLLTHIGGYPGKYDAAIKRELYELKPTLFICGHSHIAKVQYDKKLDLLHLNPGAAGNSGFHVVRTLMRFQIDAGNIHDLEVIELAPRG